uniref:Uncharacterized protein n=1 Tax=Sinocyclocheilus rhinocerous TaxID=307959 RepID=A0A673JUR7_9TELE
MVLLWSCVATDCTNRYNKTSELTFHNRSSWNPAKRFHVILFPLL